jgi:hypothetical protein
MPLWLARVPLTCGRTFSNSKFCRTAVCRGSPAIVVYMRTTLARIAAFLQLRTVKIHHRRRSQ